MSSKICLALLTAGCVALGGPAPAQKPAPLSADIIVHSVKVHTTRQGGDAWDPFGGAPDLMVFVRKTGAGGQKHTTKVKRDTFEASFAERTIRISAGDKIEVIVYDEDDKFHDRIGEKTVTITKEMLSKRHATWVFGRVISLVVEFEP